MEYLERGTHLPGLREASVTTGENKPPQLRGSRAPGRRRWCQHGVMWLEDSLVRLIVLEPLPFLPGLPVSLPIIPNSFDGPSGILDLAQFYVHPITL